MVKYFAFALLSMFSAISFGKEPVNLSHLGLDGLQPVSDSAGLKVRGLSSRAYSMSVASVSALLYDPETGSQVNIDLAHFSNSAADGVVGESSTAASEGALGLTGLQLMIGNRSFEIGPMAVFVGGQGAANGAFGATSINVPRFNR